MAYTQTLTDADKFFNKQVHIAGGWWSAQDANAKQAAFVMARRALERRKGSDLCDPATDADNNVVREDYAHFEMTAYVLASNPLRPNAESGGQDWDLINPDGEPSNGQWGAYNPLAEAERWMGWSANFVVRG